MRIVRRNERDRRTLYELGPVGPSHERWFLEGTYINVSVRYPHATRVTFPPPRFSCPSAFDVLFA